MSDDCTEVQRARERTWRISTIQDQAQNLLTTMQGGDDAVPERFKDHIDDLLNWCYTHTPKGKK